MDTLKIFCAYAPEDKKLMESFHAHLRVLELLNVSIWYAHKILPGTERDSQLHAAHIILFLVSSDFISSQEHYKKEVVPAMERHNRGETRVIPIILRPARWQETSLEKQLSSCIEEVIFMFLLLDYSFFRWQGLRNWQSR